MICIACGCSDNRACIFGCSWHLTDPPVCNRCAGREPYVATDEPDGNWHVVGPGPDGSRRVIDVDVGNKQAACEMAEAMNRAHLAGAKAALAITKGLERGKLRGRS